MSHTGESLSQRVALGSPKVVQKVWIVLDLDCDFIGSHLLYQILVINHILSIGTGDQKRHVSFYILGADKSQEFKE